MDKKTLLGKMRECRERCERLYYWHVKVTFANKFLKEHPRKKK